MAVCYCFGFDFDDFLDFHPELSRGVLQPWEDKQARPAFQVLLTLAFQGPPLTSAAGILCQ